MTPLIAPAPALELCQWFGHNCTISNSDNADELSITITSQSTSDGDETSTFEDETSESDHQERVIRADGDALVALRGLWFAKALDGCHGDLDGKMLVVNGKFTRCCADVGGIPVLRNNEYWEDAVNYIVLEDEESQMLKQKLFCRGSHEKSKLPEMEEKEKQRRLKHVKNVMTDKDFDFTCEECNRTHDDIRQTTAVTLTFTKDALAEFKERKQEYDRKHKSMMESNKVASVGRSRVVKRIAATMDDVFNAELEALDKRVIETVRSSSPFRKGKK